MSVRSDCVARSGRSTSSPRSAPNGQFRRMAVASAAWVAFACSGASREHTGGDELPSTTPSTVAALSAQPGVIASKPIDQAFLTALSKSLPLGIGGIRWIGVPNECDTPPCSTPWTPELVNKLADADSNRKFLPIFVPQSPQAIGTWDPN